jgi:uncharacterized protein
MKIWGYWTTFLWTVVAFVLGQFIAMAAIVWWQQKGLTSLMDTPYDGVLVTLFIMISNPIVIAVLAFAARLLGVNPKDYFALSWPPMRDVWMGVGVIVGLIALSDGLLFLSGHALVTPFQLQSYATAAAEGWLWPMAIAAIIVAPAGEEVMFRGFLFRGWARSDQGTWIAIVVISLLWAALHIQYDWTGILQIFVVGLILGWVRWRSGSTALTFLLHALFNLEGTLETVLKVQLFS